METTARHALIGFFALFVITAMFGFLYWLNHMGGLGTRAAYRIRFESPVSGLLIGSNVLFNGIRVGEVTGLQLETNNPSHVTAMIAVEPTTPVRADTFVSIDFQGLTGAPVVMLIGGSPSASALSAGDGQPPLLVAGAGTGQSLTQAARETLGRLDKILIDNSSAFHDAVSDLSTFSQALARNSDRVDGIVTGLERMTNGAAVRARIPVYELTAVRDFPPCLRATGPQLIIPEPTSSMALNSDKIPAVGTVPNPPSFENARFSDNIPAVIQAKLIESFENSGCFQLVSRPMEGLEEGSQFLLEIRNFRIVISANPEADIEFSVKVIAPRGKVVGVRVFRETATLNGSDAPAAMAALDIAFGKIANALVQWTSQLPADRADQKRASP